MDEIITASEVSTLLRIHIRTVYRLAEEGRIPGNKIGHGWRFIKRDVFELISERGNVRFDAEKSPRMKRVKQVGSG